MAKAIAEGHLPAAGPPFKTNADRIRTMTDEELADWLMKLNVISCDQIDFCQCKEWCIENISNIPPEHHKQCLLEWLKRSAE